MRGKVSKMSEKRNIRDHKRRLLAAKFELRRKAFFAMTTRNRQFFCRIPLSILGVPMAIWLTHLIKSQVSHLISMPSLLLIFLFLLVCFTLLYHYLIKSKKKKSAMVIYFFINVLALSFVYLLRSEALLGVTAVISSTILNVSDGVPSDSGSGPSRSTSWEGKTSFEEQVLMEPFSDTEMEGTSARSSIPRVGVNEAGPSHQGRDEAGLSHQPYPYQPDDEIGGDSGSESSEWRKYLNIPSDMEENQTPGHQAPPAPDGTEGSSSYRRESNVGRQSLSEGSSEGGSVNQPPEGMPRLPRDPTEDQPGPSHQPYPYQPDDEIGGDSVSAIKARLLKGLDSPTYEQIQFARFNAEDLFEVKVEIIRKMSTLDPTGDWLGRGARALDNARTYTGEHSLERLYAMLDALNRDENGSDTFVELKEKLIYKRLDEPEHSST